MPTPEASATLEASDKPSWASLWCDKLLNIVCYFCTKFNIIHKRDPHSASRLVYKKNEKRVFRHIYMAQTRTPMTSLLLPHHQTHFFSVKSLIIKIFPSKYNVMFCPLHFSLESAKVWQLNKNIFLIWRWASSPTSYSFIVSWICPRMSMKIALLLHYKGWKVVYTPQLLQLHTRIKFPRVP